MSTPETTPAPADAAPAKTAEPKTATPAKVEPVKTAPVPSAEPPKPPQPPAAPAPDTAPNVEAAAKATAGDEVAKLRARLEALEGTATEAKREAERARATARKTDIMSRIQRHVPSDMSTELLTGLYNQLAKTKKFNADGEDTAKIAEEALKAMKENSPALFESKANQNLGGPRDIPRNGRSARSGPKQYI